MSQPRQDDPVHQAMQAAAAGRADEAISLLRSAIAIDPHNPRALNALGNRLLEAGNQAEACALFERAVEADPAAVPIWLNLSAIFRARGDADAELRALDGALRADPYAALALLLKAQLQERIGDQRAASTYAALLACLPADAVLPPAMVGALDHARNVVSAQKTTLFEQIRASVADAGVSSARFEHCVNILVGRDKLFAPQPSGLHFPYLPAVPFFDEQLFPWFAELEDGVDAVRAELLAVVARDSGMRPYISINPGTPVNQWEALNKSLDWSAFFLWENGVPCRDNLEACPDTAALLERLPLLDIPMHTPTAMFSILKPGAVIPPHTGVSNTRAIVHLALVVPPDCGFRVGAETREWREGVAWAFDDTIEHEAWNRSDRPRAVLIMDTWNPYLSEDERTLLRLVTQSLGAGVNG